MNDFQNIFTFGYNAFWQWGGIGFVAMLIALVLLTAYLRGEAKVNYERELNKWNKLTPEQQRDRGPAPSWFHYRTDANRLIALAWVVFLVGYWAEFL